MKTDPRLIYDIGMNNGDDTAYYLAQGYRVVAVEANPILVEAAKDRFAKEIADGRLTIIPVGISEEEGDCTFWICDKYAEWSSLNRHHASRDGVPHHSITVPCVRFGSILREHGLPFYLKIDIEGGDHLCLRELTRQTAPEYISVEATGIELLDLLQALGYDRFKCISQFYFLPLEIPAAPEQLRYEEFVRSNKPLDEFRTLNDWPFPDGASGPLGEDLPGRWLTFDEMRRTFAHFKTLHKSGEASPFWTDKEYSFWADFHATKASTRMSESHE